MIINWKKISYDNRGSALIIALVVSAVLMVLCFSLLAVSYSFYLAQNKNSRSGTNDRELFYSAIEAFEQELMSSGLNHFEVLRESEIDEYTLKYYKEDNSIGRQFGTEIVVSIYNYISNEYSDDVVSDINPWPNNETRLFTLTSFGPYNIIIELYWDYDVDKVYNSSTDKLESVLLHASYTLKKKDEELIKNNRIYRMENTFGSIKKVKSDGNNTLKFDLPGNSYSFPNKNYYNVDASFLPEIKLSDDEKNDENFNVFDSRLPGMNIYTWHVGSKLNETATWNGVPKDLFSIQDGNNKTSRTARTDWDHEVPVCIKFIINDYCLDLNVYSYRYIKYVDAAPEVEAKGQYVFDKNKVNSNLSTILLKLCGVDESNIDADSNFSNIAWKIVDGNNVYDFFDPIDGKPQIKNKTFKTMGKIYYVYATFESNGYQIKKYDPSNGKIINPNGIYSSYSFARIIGE